MQNQNSVEYLEKIKIKIFENLKETTFVPSVEMQDIPRVSLGMDDEDDAMLDDADEDDNPDVRMTQRRLDQTKEASGELSESEDDGSDFVGPQARRSGGRKNEANFKETEPGSDIDENVNHSSDPSASPKSNGNESNGDVDMKDVGVAAGTAEGLRSTSNTSIKSQENLSKEPSRNSSAASNHPEESKSIKSTTDGEEPRKIDETKVSKSEETGED